MIRIDDRQMSTLSKRITDSLSLVSASQYLRLIVLSLIVLTCANLLFCAMQYELGFGNSSFLGTGPEGPTDRFADLVKISFSYRAFVSGIEAKTLESWPDVFQSYYLQPLYGGKEALAEGRVGTHFHAPPLMTLLFLASASLIVHSQSILLDIVLFYCLYLASVQWAIWVGIPREQRTTNILLVTWLFALLSYPALMVVVRGNFHSGCTSMLIMAFMLSLLVRKRVGFAALISLAIAVNFRPNAGVFVLALPLVLGLKESIKPILRFAALASGILTTSYFAANSLYPDYTLRAFLRGLDIYKRLYVIGSAGDAGNSSLWAMIKNYNTISASCSQPMLFAVLSIILLAAAFWGVRHATSWMIYAPVSLTVLYAQSLVFTRNRQDASTVFAVFSTFLIGAVCWGLWCSSNRVLVTPFILTGLYCLLCPVFADYHLLVFLTPMLLVFFNYREWAGNYRMLFAVGLVSVLLLSPKNYFFSTHNISWQTVINPLILCFGLLYVIRETAHLPQFASATESREVLASLVSD